MDHYGESRLVKRLLAVVTMVAALVVFPASAGFGGKPAEGEVVLGGLFSLTGNWSTLGRNAQAAMEIAVEDVNQYLEGNAAGIRFAAAIEDTRLEPARALEQAKALHARGVRLLIGPQSSAEVEHLKPFVDGQAMLLVSPSSTAARLALKDDNVFRFTLTDELEGVAIAKLMWADGIRVMVPVWRDDAGNAGLEAATRKAFTDLGGIVLPGVKYGAVAQDFGATVGAAAAQLNQAIGEHGVTQTAVYLAAFDEVVELFASANQDATARSVRWYGSNGVARSDVLISNPQAVEFAIHTGYPNPVFGLDEGARDIWTEVQKRIRARTGLDPDAFAFAVYDAVWVVARGYVASGATQDVERLKHAFMSAAATHYGATGWTVLDEAGDRRYGDFDFWAVQVVSGQPAWTRAGRYESRTERLLLQDPG
jgi:branched-chain amino acid transport system substrate-binding protein